MVRTTAGGIVMSPRELTPAADAEDLLAPLSDEALDRAENETSLICCSNPTGKP
jgi:hypothetical protein